MRWTTNSTIEVLGTKLSRKAFVSLEGTGPGGDRLRPSLATYHCRNNANNIKPVGKRCDHQTCSVAEVLVAVPELSITDVGKAVALVIIPPEWGRGWR